MAPSVAFLIGTSREDGNTWHVLRHVNHKHAATIISLADLKISYFDYQHRNIDDDFIATIETLLKYDTIGFVSPVYWYTVSAQMKVFIDRLSDLLGPRKDLGRRLRGKSTFLLATGSTDEQLPSGMDDTIKLTSDYLGMKYRGAFYAKAVSDKTFTSKTLEEAQIFIDSMLGG